MQGRGGASQTDRRSEKFKTLRRARAQQPRGTEKEGGDSRMGVKRRFLFFFFFFSRSYTIEEEGCRGRAMPEKAGEAHLEGLAVAGAAGRAG